MGPEPTENLPTPPTEKVGVPKVEDKGASRRATHACPGTTIHYLCPECGSTATDWTGCGQPTCTHSGCRASVAGRRARRTWARLSLAEAVPWAAVVLTVPGECRAQLTAPEAQDALRREAVQLVSRWLQRWSFRSDDARPGGVVVWHPCGEDEADPSPHLNFIAPLRALTSGGSRRGRWMLPPEALAWLRAGWARILRAYGWGGWCGVQVRYTPRVRYAERVHAARYYLRGFPGWQGWTHRIRYWGFFASHFRGLPGGEPEAWPTPAIVLRCECGGTRRIARVETAVCGPPQGGMP